VLHVDAEPEFADLVSIYIETAREGIAFFDE